MRSDATQRDVHPARTGGGSPGMTAMSFLLKRPRFPRRGVTLVEMLVTVALLVLMMTVIVQVFQAATGAVSSSRAYQDLDSGFRQLDATIRQDLGNITARMTPPLDP